MAVSSICHTSVLAGSLCKNGLIVRLQAFHPLEIDNVQASILSPTSRIPRHLLASTDPAHGLARSQIVACQAYKLLGEAGKLVNLADWYGAFLSTVSDDNAADVAVNQATAVLTTPQKPHKRRKGGADGMVEDGDEQMDPNGTASTFTVESKSEASFLDAVGDLAFLGYVLPTKRKPEHTLRAVF